MWLLLGYKWNWERSDECAEFWITISMVLNQAHSWSLLGTGECLLVPVHMCWRIPIRNCGMGFYAQCSFGLWSWYLCKFSSSIDFQKCLGPCDVSRLGCDPQCSSHGNASPLCSSWATCWVLATFRISPQSVWKLSSHLMLSLYI